MSETVKLIIEIDKRAYKACQELSTNNDDGIVGLCAVNTIANGIPLDSNSEKAEVQAYFDGQAYGWEEGRKALIDDLKAEIAEEICLTDNPYTNETKYTIEHSKLLEILDNIGKETDA